MRRQATDAAAGLNRLLRALLEIRAKEGSHLPGYAEPIVLFLGARSNGSAAMRELRDELGLGQSRASRLCAALARAGLVRVDTATEDRRASRVRLTAKGFRLVGKVASALDGKSGSTSA
jgi:DNA-binding MarR family transcriptional regulator